MLFITGLLLLLFDITFFTIIHNPVTQTLLWFHLIILLQPERSALSIWYLWPLLVAESFIFWGIPGIELIYLIPITLLGIFLKSRMHQSIVIPFTLACLCLVIQYGIIEWGIFGLSPLKDYTIRKIFINLGIVLGMSLKTYWRGNLGNRL